MAIAIPYGRSAVIRQYTSGVLGLQPRTCLQDFSYRQRKLHTDRVSNSTYKPDFAFAFESASQVVVEEFPIDLYLVLMGS